VRVRRPVAPLSGRPDPEMTQYPAYRKQDTSSFEQSAANYLTDKIMHLPITNLQAQDRNYESDMILLWPLRDFKVINLLAGR
jgi:hypothetical protein